MYQHTLQSYKGRGSQRVEPEVVTAPGCYRSDDTFAGGRRRRVPRTTARGSRAVGFFRPFYLMTLAESPEIQTASI
jgi:hypothetical protein